MCNFWDQRELPVGTEFIFNPSRYEIDCMDGADCIEEAVYY
jgi:hypothetical protein